MIVVHQRRRICSGLPASNAAIATSCHTSGNGGCAYDCSADEENLLANSCHTSGSGGCACYWDAEEENLFGIACQQRCDSHFPSCIRKWWLRLFLGCRGGDFVRDGPPATLQ